MLPTKICGMEFSIFSPEMIRDLAVVRISTSELYDSDGYPVDGGIMDPRLGVIDPGMRCRTCNGRFGECPGHFGYIELAYPVINVLFTKHIYYLLKATCCKCYRIMNKNARNLEDAARNAPKKCPYCNKEQMKINFVKPYMFYEDKEELDPMKIRERFENIPDEDLDRIGFRGGRPEWLILTLFPIPPVTIRPSITLETGERSEDDLTHKLSDIVRINQSLKENIEIGAPEFIIKDLWELLQYHIATYMDNELTGVPQARHRSGRPLKGIIQRLKAKEGRIRGNLLGKRVNYSSRTVISPDPRLDINEVGIPEVVAKELTIPVYVTKNNIEICRDMINKNIVNYVIRPDGRRIRVNDTNIQLILENLTIGWVLERQLKDGDIVLFNRQPSLHKISIMAHNVRVLPGRTFRLNPSVCPPYNADFDGDEMNLHALQSIEAMVEADMLMNVKRNIISPRFGGPIIALDLDQISGIYLLTKENRIFNKEETAQLLANANIDIELPDKKQFTGKEIVSFLLPKNLNMKFVAKIGKTCEKCKNGEKCKHDGYVVIKNGILERGVFDEEAIGAFAGKVINKARFLLNDDELSELINNLGRLGISYLMYRGFSIGISDLDLDEDILKDVEKTIKDSKKNVDELVEKYKKGEIEIIAGFTAIESLETQILSILAECLNRVNNIVSSKIKYSDIIAMAECGAKGSLINTTQMAACIGSETLQGKRIHRGYLFRTLPHFRKHDLGAESHGFVSRGFKQGLNPFEFFWNLMNGREGLMDKSLRTRKSGYMQRRLMNSLQDLIIHKDLSVRDSYGNIVQFIAGEDGISPEKSSFGKLDLEVVM